MKCIHCSSERVVKNGTKTLKSQEVRQRYLCQDLQTVASMTAVALRWRDSEPQ
jgi:transposase-like protein